MHVRSLALVLFVSSTTAIGCAANQVEDEPAKESAASSEGLTLEARTSERVSGHFTKDGARLGFEFSRERGKRIAALRDTEGRPLLTSTLEDGIETIRVRDGALVASGPTSALEPEQLSGDASAFEALGKTREMALLEPLQEALSASGVDRALFSTNEAPVAKAGAITPAQYYGSDGYWHLGPGESRTFGTWAFWSSTYVRVRNYTTARCATVQFKVGWSYETNVIPAGGYRGFSRQWAAMPVTVVNMNAWIDWGGGQVCGPVTMGVITQ